MTGYATYDMINGRYQLIKKVGRGAFGEVWLAKDTQTGINVAVKLYIALDDKGVEEFRTEYRTAYSLNHPHLLHAFFFDICQNRPFLVMPFCPGAASDLIGSNDERTIWQFIRDTASGLEYLHSQDIVHRDIKPDNILRDPDGNFLITDFGISQKMKSTLRRNSKREQEAEDTSGTIGYMGPEMFVSHPIAVKATDIWAFGVTLYEILTGELPFFGQGGVMALHGADSPEIPGEWSDNLKSLVLSCLMKNTWDRPTATTLKDFAQSVLDGQNVTWNKPQATPETGPGHESIRSVREVIERMTADGLYKDAYNKCMECVQKGIDVDYAQKKSTELVLRLKAANKKHNAKTTVILVVFSIVSTLIAILYIIVSA